MARGINLSFLADVRDLLRGTSSVEDALEDVAGSLSDVVTDSAQAQEAMSADFAKIAADANQTGKSIGDDISTGSKRAGESAGKVKEGFKGTGEELKAEGLSGAASFDGSMSSAADSAQAFSSVALSAFGPIGAGLGIAAAAGFGAFRAQAAKAKEAVDKLFDALVDGQGRLNDSFKESQLADWAKDGTLETLARQATALGISYGTAVRAALGSADAVQAVAEATDRVASSQESFNEARDRGAGVGRAGILATTELEKTTGKAAATLDDARRSYDLYSDAAKGAGIATDETTAAVDDSASSFRDQASAILDARGQARDYQQALDDATQALKDNGATLDIHTQKGRDNQAALDDVARAALADGEVRKSERQHYLDLAEAMGLSETAAGKLADKLKLLPDTTSVKVKLDTTDLDRALNRLGDGRGGFRWDSP